ncbi:glycerol-3-phosphate 1-O-acyltransferase PlsY [Neisseriaceae bacterium B1]
MFFLEILIVVAAYLIGSLSAALIVSKKLGMPDPRSYGSGNPGASNMLRSGRKDAAAWTLVGDALKGLIAVWVARAFCAGMDDIGGGVVACAAIAVVIGHMYPVFFGFRGGKGVATALGVLLGMSFWVTFWVVLIWALVALKFHKSSLAALVAAVCAPFVTFIVLREDHVPSWGWAIFFIAILVIYRHKDNIKRLCGGNELEIGKTASNYAATSAATVATPTNNEVAAVVQQADEAVADTVAEVVEPAVNTEKVDVEPLPEKEEEIDVSQADLRDGDELEEEVIAAAVKNAEAAQQAVTEAELSTPAEQAEVVEEEADIAAEENAEVKAPKKRGRKKATPAE